MKKIAFTLYVTAIIIMLPLCAVLELHHGAKKASKTDTSVSVIEKVKEPSKAFVKVMSHKGQRIAKNSLTTVNVIKLKS